MKKFTMKLLLYDFFTGRMTNIENIDDVLMDGIKEPVLMIPISMLLI